MTADTRTLILGSARKLAQRGGYAALNFRDLALAVGIKSASVHYHFPTKPDLAVALLQQYTADMQARLDKLMAADTPLHTRLEGYCAIFRSTLRNGNRMCIYAIMAAEYADLPPAVRAEVDRFNAVNVQWLQQLLTSAGAATEADAPGRALAMFAAVEGAQLVARERHNAAVFDTILAAYWQTGLFPGAAATALSAASAAGHSAR